MRNCRSPAPCTEHWNMPQSRIDSLNTIYVYDLKFLLHQCGEWCASFLSPQAPSFSQCECGEWLAEAQDPLLLPSYSKLPFCYNSQIADQAVFAAYLDYLRPGLSHQPTTAGASTIGPLKFDITIPLALRENYTYLTRNLQTHQGSLLLPDWPQVYHNSCSRHCKLVLRTQGFSFEKWTRVKKSTPKISKECERHTWPKALYCDPWRLGLGSWNLRGFKCL